MPFLPPNQQRKALKACPQDRQADKRQGGKIAIIYTGLIRATAD